MDAVAVVWANFKHARSHVDLKVPAGHKANSRNENFFFLNVGVIVLTTNFAWSSLTNDGMAAEVEAAGL